MEFNEYKVITIVEGGFGTIFLGASGIPAKKMEEALNKEAEGGWQVVFQIIERKRFFVVLGTRSDYYYVRAKKIVTHQNIILS
ncbi:MAG: DUF4177 domain-containing protein [Sulfurospirillum sp.]|nr:DUF4177 domain-containing protein [Sulfurospirillum sp.]